MWLPLSIRLPQIAGFPAPGTLVAAISPDRQIKVAAVFIKKLSPKYAQ
jgi:hypothetical protein